MWRVLCVLCLVTLNLGSGAAFGGTDEAYLPVAKAKLHINSKQGERFVDIIEQISKKYGDSIENLSFPKDGRLVRNFTIRISNKTFFTVNNFRNSEQMELNAYSHENSATWSGQWDDLLHEVQEDFGASSVDLVQVQP